MKPGRFIMQNIRDEEKVFLLKGDVPLDYNAG